MSTPQFPDVVVQLVGEDGNAFNLIGIVVEALRRAGYTKESNQFTNDAMDCGSYDELLQLCASTVVVQ